MNGKAMVIASPTWISSVAVVYPGADAVRIEKPSLEMKPPAVIVGCVAGTVAPGAMKTVGGATVYFEGSLLVSVTVTPEGGAGVDKPIGSGTVLPIPTAWKTGRMTVGDVTTVTVAAVAGIPGRELAWTVAVPGATLVTGTFTLVELAGRKTVDGTVATLGALELTLIVTPPAGAGDDSARVRLFVVAVPVITRFAGWKLSAELTDTVWLADPMPDAWAVMMEEPNATPVTLGVELPAVWPWAMKMAPGEMVTFEGSLLVRLMNAPPAGAGVPKVMGKFTVSPGARLILAGRMIAAAPATVMPAVAGANPAALAVMVADPGDPAVTGTVTLLPFEGTVTVAGTEATAGLVEFRFTVRPPTGAGDGRDKVRFWVPAPMIVRLPGDRISAEVLEAITCAVADGKPEADAVMVTDPTATPVTFG